MRYSRGGLPVIFLLPFLPLLPRLVGAIDLITYGRIRCVGAGTLYSNVSPGFCYDFGENSVSSVTFTQNTCNGYAYRSEMCSDPVATGTGGTCLSFRSGLKSARLSCPDNVLPHLLANTNNQTMTCVEPHTAGVVYTEDPNKGTWILETGHAKEVFTELMNVDENGKAKWLQAQGASFQPAIVTFG